MKEAKPKRSRKSGPKPELHKIDLPLNEALDRLLAAKPQPKPRKPKKK